MSIQGHTLEVTVVGCNRLKDTEWVSRQDPYVTVEYANSKFRTRTCTDGGTYPSFNDKFCFTLAEGLREMRVTVWNSNTIRSDNFIASGMIPIEPVLSTGLYDMTWPLQTRSGKSGGEITLVLKYDKSQKSRHNPPIPPDRFTDPYPPPSPYHPYIPPPSPSRSSLYPQVPFSHPPIVAYPPPPAYAQPYQPPLSHAPPQPYPAPHGYRSAGFYYPSPY